MFREAPQWFEGPVRSWKDPAKGSKDPVKASKNLNRNYFF